MRCLVWTVGSLVVLAAVPPRVRAYEDELTLGVAVGYAGMPGSGALPENGIDFALSAGCGLGDAWSIQGVLSYNLFPDDAALHLSMAGLETLYALDIVRFVPLIGFGLDGLLSVREHTARGDFALHGLLGFDFLINARWVVGADVRTYWVATHEKSPLGPFVIAAGVRASVRLNVR